MKQIFLSITLAMALIIGYLFISPDVPPILSKQVHAEEDLQVILNTEFKDISYKEIDGKNINLDIYTPTKQRYKKTPVVLFFHGGEWRYGDKEIPESFLPIVNTLRSEGIAVVSANYRLVDKSSSIKDSIDDCADAARWITKNYKEFGFDTENIGVLGVSSGAHLALLTAYNNENNSSNYRMLKDVDYNIKYVVSYSGPTDLTTLDNKEFKSALNTFASDLNSKESLEKLSPINYVSSSSPNTLIVHGEMDEVVPLSQGNALYKAGISKGCDFQLNVISGGNHALSNAKTFDLLSLANNTLDFMLYNIRNTY